MKKILCVFYVISLLIFSSHSFAMEWQIIGAGNATCSHWKMSAATDKEILSWMTGFATAENLDRASEGKAEFRLELLTYNFLENRINKTCGDKKNIETPIISILIEILKDFPTLH